MHCNSSSGEAETGRSPVEDGGSRVGGGRKTMNENCPTNPCPPCPHLPCGCGARSQQRMPTPVNRAAPVDLSSIPLSVLPCCLDTASSSIHHPSPQQHFLLNTEDTPRRQLYVGEESVKCLLHIIILPAERSLL